MLGRATQGVKIMKFAEDTKLVAMAKVINEDEEVEKQEAEQDSEKAKTEEGKAKASGKKAEGKAEEAEKEDGDQIEIKLYEPGK